MAGSARPRPWPSGGTRGATRPSSPARPPRPAAPPARRAGPQRVGGGPIREEDPEFRVRAVPMGVPLPPAADAAAGPALRERFGLPAGPARARLLRLPDADQAHRRGDRGPGRAGARTVHLLIVGEAASVMDLEGEAAAGRGGRPRARHWVSFPSRTSRPPSPPWTSASTCAIRRPARPRPRCCGCWPRAGRPSSPTTPSSPTCRRRSRSRVPLGDEEAEALAGLLRELLAQPGAAAGHGRARRASTCACGTIRPRSPRRSLRGLPRVAELAPPGDDPGGRPELPPASEHLAWGACPGRSRSRVPTCRGPRGSAGASASASATPRFARWLAGEARPGRRRRGGQALRATRPLGPPRRPAWLALPRDLAPGEEVWLETEVRRPLGPASSRIEPHLFGGLRSLSPGRAPMGAVDREAQPV